MSRWPGVAVCALAAVALLSGCGGGTSSYSPRSSVTAASQPTESGAAGVGAAEAGSAGSQPAAGASTAGRVARDTALPASLVGAWSGDDHERIGSWSLTFAANGRYRMRNERRGSQIDGQAAVQGNQLMFQPANAKPYAVSWSVSGGRLSLNGDVYLRIGAGAAGGPPALVGQWMSLKNLYRTVTFSADGRYLITDPVNGDVAGTYTVSGDNVTVAANGGAPTTFGWSVDDSFLRMRRADGSIAEYTRSG
jgi:hypothetical protein